MPRWHIFCCIMTKSMYVAFDSINDENKHCLQSTKVQNILDCKNLKHPFTMHASFYHACTPILWAASIVYKSLQNLLIVNRRKIGDGYRLPLQNKNKGVTWRCLLWLSFFAVPLQTCLFFNQQYPLFQAGWFKMIFLLQT